MQLLAQIIINLILINLVSSQACSSSDNEVKIICGEILHNEYVLVGVKMSCKVRNSINTTLPDSSISSVLDSNGLNVTNLSTVNALDISDVIMNFIPTGIKIKFTNIDALLIISSELLSLNKENLREFGSALVFLDLGNNMLTFIDEDLFEYNPNMKVFSFHGNPIRYIEPGLFKNVKNLKNCQWANFNRLSCMSQHYQAESGHNLDSLVWSNGQCTDKTAKLETQIALLTRRIESLRSEQCVISAKYMSIEDRDKLKNDLVELREKVLELLKTIL